MIIAQPNPAWCRRHPGHGRRDRRRRGGRSLGRRRWYGLVGAACLSGRDRTDGDLLRAVPNGGHPPAPREPPATPADIQAAYHLSATAGAGQVVGIVDAQDDPKAEADLAKFRSAYGLPPCTTANGCFRKVNQRGKASPLPAGDQGWGLEISLDLDAVSSACPACKILLVEGDSSALDRSGNRGEHGRPARGQGGVQQLRHHRVRGHGRLRPQVLRPPPACPIVVSSGDAGFGPANFPAVLGNVIAVGGTSLRQGARNGAGLEGDRVERRQQRLLGLHRQAGLADGHPLPDAHGRRRLGRRRP